MYLKLWSLFFCTVTFLKVSLEFLQVHSFFVSHSRPVALLKHAHLYLCSLVQFTHLCMYYLILPSYFCLLKFLQVAD